MKKGVCLYFLTLLFTHILLFFSFTLSAQLPPNEPILLEPAQAAVEVVLSPTLSVEVSDPESDNLTVTFYGRRKVSPTEKFTIVGLPDTQYYTGELWGGSTEIFNSQTQWIVDNKDSRNIVFVTHLGDCTENADDFEVEWQRADAAMRTVEDPALTALPDGIPYGIAVGNHDQLPFGDPDGTTLLYNKWFGESRFDSRDYYGGHYGSNNDNHYQLFSAAGMDFIAIHLEFDPDQDPAVLSWADGLLSTYSDRRAILVSHFILSPGNPGTFQAQGQAIYDGLKDNPNLFLMLGAHWAGEGRRTDVYNGSTVHSLLADYQDRANGGDGWLRIMEFDPATNTIQIKTYSPWLDQWETDADSEFSLSYDMSVPWVTLGSNTNVASGSVSSLIWPNLEPQTEYEWYVAVEDGGNLVTGNTWSFTTGADNTNNALDFGGINQYVTFGRSTGVTGTLVNSPTWVTETGISPPPAGNHSLQFNGTNQYVTFGLAEGLGSNSFTVECWFKRTAAGTSSSTGTGGIATMVPLVSKGADESEGSNLDANFVLGIADGGAGNSYIAGDFEDLGGAPNNHPKIGTTPILLNTWYHAALTYDNISKEYKLFLNGLEEGSTQVLDGIVPQWDSQQHAALATMLESDGTSTNGFFSGKIDEPRIWNYARSQAEIQSNMDQEIEKAIGLKGRWGLNEGSGSVLNPSDNKMGLKTFTLEAWVKREGTGVQATTGAGGVDAIPLITKGRSESEGNNRDVNFFLGINNNSSSGPLNVLVADFEDFAASANNNPVFGSTALLNDVWYHVAAAFDGADWKLYLNGIEDGSASTGSGSVPRFDCIQHAGLGTAINSAGVAEGFFDGILEEVRIWDFARSQEEIRNDMHRPVPDPEGEANLVGYYTFNSSRGSILPDDSSNDLPGTLINMTSGTEWIVSTAPIPYYTVGNGDWDADANWESGQQAPVNAWSRIRIDHVIQQDTDEEAIDLQIGTDGSLTVLPAKSLTVSGALVNEAGENGLVLKSDGSGMASLVHSSNGVAATAELYLTNNVWHYSAAPTSDALSGDFLGSYLRSFDESSYDWNAYITQTTIPLEVMRGYAAWNSDVPATVLFQGILNVGPQNIGVSATTPQSNPGWNLVGNPFASSLDWDGVGWDKSNIDNTLYFWEGVGGDGGSGNYHYYVGSGGSGGSGWDPVPVNDGTNEIPPMQGFFVKANNTGTLSVTNEARIHSGQAYYKSKNDQIPLIRLRVESEDKKDETVIRFYGDASSGFDGQFDAIKLFSGTCPQLYSITASDQDLAVNTLPELNEDVEVPLGFVADSEGMHAIHLSEFEHFSGQDILLLQDLKTDVFVDLTAQRVYEFYAAPADETKRFILRFKKLEIIGSAPETVDIYSFGQVLVVNNRLAESGWIHVYNLLGEKLATALVASQSVLHIKLEKADGIHAVDFESGGYRTTAKVLLR